MAQFGGKDFMDVAFIGVQDSVLSFKKETGEVQWKTTLGGGFGNPFVTLATDGVYVFAHSRGKLFCLDAQSGKILWTNELPGLGYGIASICAQAGSSDATASLKEAEKASSGS
jgi:outer membrane protein assembly factor BamB